MRKHNSKPLEVSQDYNALVFNKPGSGMSFFELTDNRHHLALAPSGKGMSFMLDGSK